MVPNFTLLRTADAFHAIVGATPRPTPTFTLADELARLTDSQPVQVLRRRCCYCASMHPLDDLGPILTGQDVSDGICPAAMAIQFAEMDARHAARQVA